jgi:hypothetical protein
MDIARSSSIVDDDDIFMARAATGESAARLPMVDGRAGRRASWKFG